MIKLLLLICVNAKYAKIKFPHTKKSDIGISFIISDLEIFPAKGKKISAVKKNRIAFNDIGSTVITPNFMIGACAPHVTTTNNVKSKSRVDKGKLFFRL